MRLTLIELETIKDELLNKILAMDEAEDPTELINLYDQLQQQLADKTDAIVCSLKALEGEITYLKSRRDEFNQKIKARENKVKRFKEWLLNTMINSDRDCLKGKETSIKIVENGGKQPIEINPEIKPHDIPMEYTKLELDLQAIADGLGDKNELIINGLILAKKLPRGEHLRFK